MSDDLLVEELSLGRVGRKVTFTSESPSSPASSSPDEEDRKMRESERETAARHAEAARADPRLQKALRLVRQMSSSNLKEQCVISEWSAMRTDTERDVLLEAVVDPSFWREVKQMAVSDMDATHEEEEDADTEGRLLQMFKCFDVDCSGTIDCNELHQMLLYMGLSATESEVRELIRQVDGDGDGLIVESEFMLVMKQAQAGKLSIAAPTKQNIRRASFKISQMARPQALQASE
jgi:hypothetical protein